MLGLNDQGKIGYNRLSHQPFGSNNVVFHNYLLALFQLFHH